MRRRRRRKRTVRSFNVEVAEVAPALRIPT